MYLSTKSSMVDKTYLPAKSTTVEDIEDEIEQIINRLQDTIECFDRHRYFVI